MMKKIVIIDHEPFTIRRKAIFYVDELISRGFEMEFWDCSQLCHSGLKIADEVKESYVRKITSFEEVVNILEEIDCRKIKFIVELYDNLESLKIFRVLVKKKCYLIKQEMYATARLVIEKSLFEKIIELSFPDLIKKIIKRLSYLYMKIYKFIFKLHYNLVISSGDGPDVNIYFNHPDWELARKISNAEHKSEQPKYAVFLDEYFPVHPDIKYFFQQHLEKEQEPYRNRMCTFFDYIENKYDLEVIIAAHPKSDYNEYYWEGRKCYKYKTAELVKNAELVFLHGSAAISFAVIFGKPIAILTTNGYNKVKVLSEHMKRLSSIMRLTIFNIDVNFDIEVKKLIPQISNAYIYHYLTHKGIEDKENIEILTQCLKK